MSLSSRNFWIGVVVKTGGTLFLAGTESLTGYIVRSDQIADPSSYYGCTAFGIRLGPGLGGSVGISLLGVFNAQFYTQVHKVDLGGPSLTVSAVEKIGRIPIKKEEYEILEAFAKGVKVAENKNKLNYITNLANNIMGSFDAYDGHPAGIIVDVPYAGWGIELSAVWNIHYELKLDVLS
ncbi:MAG TPA: hypothetical protein VMT76_01200 [Puia sp.]|nr:hypothetical protein [Puia sp.]